MEGGFLPEGLDLFHLARIKHVAVDVGHFIFRMPHQLASHGDHLPESQRGAEAALDSALYDNVIQPNRWDSLGDYTTPPQDAA